MKHYTSSSLTKLPWASSATKQAPFPGRWPTRVMLVWKDKVYFGKPPGANFYAGLRKLPTRMLEFDRAHIIMDTNKGRTALTRLARMYHPGAAQFVTLGVTHFVGWFDTHSHVGKRKLVDDTEVLSYLPK